MLANVAYSVVCLALLSVITFFMILRYRSNFVSWRIALTAFLTWVLCFSFHALLPVDIYISNYSQE